MKKIIITLMFQFFFIAGCTSAYPSRGVQLQEVVEPSNTPYHLPTKTATITPTSTNIPVDDTDEPIEPEEVLRTLFEYFFESEQYDSSFYVLHKYYDDLDFIFQNNGIYMVLAEETDTDEDFVELAIETIYLAGAMGGWESMNTDHIELVYPSITDWDYKLYIDGRENILKITDQNTNVFNLMEFELSPVIVSQITQSAVLNVIPPTKPPTQQVFVPTSETTNALPECKTYNSGTVKCRIEHAYCSYHSSVNGQPTYCNDAPYPTQNFTYVVWGQDVSYLDGHCIIVYGKIDYYNEKPQIMWQNNDGFDGYCD